MRRLFVAASHLAVVCALILSGGCSPQEPAPPRSDESESKQSKQQSSEDERPPESSESPSITTADAEALTTFTLSPNGYKALAFAAWTERADDNFDDVFDRDCRQESDSLTCAILADPAFTGGESPPSGKSERSPSDDDSDGDDVRTRWFDEADPLTRISRDFPIESGRESLRRQLDAVANASRRLENGDRPTARARLEPGIRAATEFLELTRDAYGRTRGSGSDADPPGRPDLCEEYADPTTDEEFAELEHCDSDRLYCPKGPEDEEVIMGTSGDDILIGSERPEIICGLGGDDVIIGNGGSPKDQNWLATDEVWDPDKTYGGPGDDLLIGSAHTDWMQGNDGDDVLLGKNSCYQALDVRIECTDRLFGDSHVTLGPAPEGDEGNDVLISGPITSRDTLVGGDGDDLLVAAPFPLSRSSLSAGDGKDVVLALNFSPVPSSIRMKKKEPGTMSIAIPLNSACTVRAELDTRDPEGGSDGSVSCNIPWPTELSGLNQVLPMSASVGSDGAVSFNATLYNRLGSISLSSLDDMVEFQASLDDDVCICDPLRASPPTTIAELGLPWDHIRD